MVPLNSINLIGQLNLFFWLINISIYLILSSSMVESFDKPKLKLQSANDHVRVKYLSSLKDTIEVKK